MEKNQGKRILIILIIVSLLILFAGLAGQGVTFRVIGEIIFIRPVNYVLSVCRSFAEDISNTVGIAKQKVALEKENKALKDALSDLEKRNKMLMSLYYENIDLKNALSIKEKNKNWELSVANVIGVSTIDKTIVIDKGITDGIKENMPVIYSTDGETQNLVGMISEVGERSSKIIISTNPLFKVGVKNILRGGIHIATGNNDTLTMEIVEKEPNVFSRDIYVTTGYSDIYPEGIVVGKVIKINRKSSIETEIFLDPVLNFAHLMRVFVLVKYE